MLGTKTERHYGVLIFSLGFIILFQSLAIGHDASRLEQPALTILMPFEGAPAGPEGQTAGPIPIAVSSKAMPPTSSTTHDAVAAKAQDAAQQPIVAPPVEDLTYTMQKGDTFYGIASQFGMSPRELASANALPRPWAPTGTVLRIPRTRPVLADDGQPAEPIEMSYMVRKGDTLGNIAERFHINVSDLMTDNKMLDGREPAAGKQVLLKIPPTFTYRVSEGESLWKVSKTFEVSLTSLVDLNSLALADLKAGQVIKVPVSDPSIFDRLWKAKHPEVKKPVDTKFHFPVFGRMTDRFGYRIHPIYQVQNFHSGVDFAAATGTPIRSSRPGVVEFSGMRAGYGRLVVVRHPDGLQTWYGHCSKLVAKAGAKVKAGTLLARVGSSGSSTGPHLHFEIRRNDRPVNPMKYLRA